MPELIDTHGIEIKNPDAAALAEAFEQVKNPTVAKASATLTLDSGEYITIHPTREAVFGNGRDATYKHWFPTWEEMLAIWLQLLAGNIAEIQATFGPSPISVSAPVCPKCQIPMANGFMLDRDRGVGRAASWYPGIPSFGVLGGIKRPEEPCFETCAYRCATCGKLELYALKPI